MERGKSPATGSSSEARPAFIGWRMVGIGFLSNFLASGITIAISAMVLVRVNNFT
jgi:hypothetical protein